MVTDERSGKTSTPFPNEIITEEATHAVSETDLAEALATIHVDLIDGSDAIHKHYVSETDNESLSPVITEQGLAEVIYVESAMWEQMADRLDIAADVRTATKAAHERYARTVTSDENSAERDPLVMPGHVLSGLTRAGLSRRQAEVQVLRMAGNTQDEIGTELGMDTGTVKSHCHRIDQKVGNAEYLLDLVGEQTTETSETTPSDRTEHEIYPMPLFPQLVVSDVKASTAWYQALGFEVVYSMSVMTHLRYRKYADLMLISDQSDLEHPAEDTPRDHGVSIYITVEDESVDAVAERADASGADGPYETAWNTREVTLVDPDGYELVFTELADPDKALEDVMGSPPHK